MTGLIGYAAKLDGEVDLRTVGPTEVSAQTNALLVLFGYAASNDQTNAQIDTVWREACEHAKNKKRDVSIVSVRVTEAIH